ncbi:MAG: riboflavin synthase [Desulfurococcales archaeon]|nr:riboflavin synthase [Desulfurococcales archaeon]
MRHAEKCVGVVDTTFARVDMARPAMEELEKLLPGYRIIRHTVPGIKDLPGAAKRLVDQYGCRGVITLGWVGRREADKYSYLAMSIGLIMAELLTGSILVDVTVHEDESSDPEELRRIALDRARKHARNLALMLKEGPTALSRHAGRGLRQGYPDAGPL